MEVGIPLMGTAHSPVRVLVVQDHPLLASAIAKILDSQEDLTVCAVARNGLEAAKLAGREEPNVVLMDFRLPDLSGPAAAANIKSVVPAASIVFHSADETETSLLDAIDAGATAYLTKSATADQIVEAVRKAAVGEVLIPVELFAKAIARQRKVFTDEQARRGDDEAGGAVALELDIEERRRDREDDQPARPVADGEHGDGQGDEHGEPGEGEDPSRRAHRSQRRRRPLLPRVRH